MNDGPSRLSYPPLLLPITFPSFHCPRVLSDASFFLRLTSPGSPFGLGLSGPLGRQAESISPWSLALISPGVSQGALAVDQPAGLHSRLHGGHLFRDPSCSSSFRTSLGCRVAGYSRDLMGSVCPGWRKQSSPSDPGRRVSDTKGATKAKESWGSEELGMPTGQPLLIRVSGTAQQDGALDLKPTQQDMG